MLLRALRHPRAVMTFSDSGAHLSQIADSSIHTHLLGHWVRDRQEFTLEEAVRMITLAPALAWGFADQGLLRAGHGRRPQRLRPGDRRPRRADPGRRPARPAGRRLEQRSVGFLATVVAGQVTIERGDRHRRRTGPPAPDRPVRTGPDRPLTASRGCATVRRRMTQRPVVAHGVVEVADAEGEVAPSGGRVTQLVDHGVGVERRLVGRRAEVDQRVGRARACWSGTCAAPASPVSHSSSVWVPRAPVSSASGWKSPPARRRRGRPRPGRSAAGGPAAPRGRRSAPGRSQHRHRVDRAARSPSGSAGAPW